MEDNRTVFEIIDGIPGEKAAAELCDYCHDYDGSVYEEESCRCSLIIKEGKYFLRRKASLRWDYKPISSTTEDIPVSEDELKLTRNEFCKLHCTNDWAKKTYRIFDK